MSKEKSCITSATSCSTCRPTTTNLHATKSTRRGDATAWSGSCKLCDKGTYTKHMQTLPDSPGQDIHNITAASPAYLPQVREVLGMLTTHDAWKMKWQQQHRGIFAVLSNSNGVQLAMPALLMLARNRLSIPAYTQRTERTAQSIQHKAYLHAHASLERAAPPT